MKQTNKKIYTYIANFRGGTYCTQVMSDNVQESLIEWIEKLKTEKSEIKFLGSKVISEIQIAIKEEDNNPTAITGLKNIWFVMFATSTGTFYVNIVQTDFTE